MRVPLAAALLAALSSAVLATTPTPLQVNISTPATAHSVSDSYISFNFDYHLNDEFGWVNASILFLNLSDPRLRTLAAALAPGHLRIGGSQGDEVVYDVHGTECAQASSKWANTTFCLTMARWDEINEFAAATGLTIAMGLNCMAGRDAKGSGFNITNLADFLAYTAAHKNSVYAVEYGNEKQTTIPADVYAADVLRVRAVIDALWPTPALRPLLVANDENPNAGYWRAMLPAVSDAIQVASWHMYSGYGLDPTLPSKAWSKAFYGLVDETARPLIAAAANFTAAGGVLWVGETAMAWHSGRDNTTNSYLSSPWFLAQLGALSATHAVQCRQALLGGFYELIDRFTMIPNSDFWAALIWKRTMGARVLAAPNDAWGDVLTYAHCAVGGGVAIVFINSDANSTYEVQFDGVPSADVPPAAQRLEYILTPDGAPDSKRVLLNGAPLAFEGGVLSPTPPRVAQAAPLLLAPHTIGFIVLPSARLPACDA